MEELRENILRAKQLFNKAKTQQVIDILTETMVKYAGLRYDLWEVAKMLSDCYVNNARIYEKSGMIFEAIKELIQAKRVTHPTRGQSWNQSLDWKICRINILKTLAENYEK